MQKSIETDSLNNKKNELKNKKNKLEEAIRITKELKQQIYLNWKLPKIERNKWYRENKELVSKYITFPTEVERLTDEIKDLEWEINPQKLSEAEIKEILRDFGSFFD